MSIEWTVTTCCNNCDAKFVQGPVAIGPRDELMLGEPPDGWQRFEISSSERVLPRFFDKLIEGVRNQPVPPEMMEGQIEMLEATCPMMHMVFDFCGDCLEDPEMPTKLMHLISAEKERLLHLVEVQMQKHADNVISPNFGAPEPDA